MSSVAIVKGIYPEDITVKALEMIKIDETLTNEKPVLIKPNYLNASHPSTGITTDSRVIEGIIKFLKQKEVHEIIIGEGSGFSDTFESYRVAGVDKVADRWNLKLVDLNKDDYIELHPQNPLSLKKVKLAKTALESTIISVPKLKLHRLAGVSLSIKNMMGVMKPKGSMHTHLSSNIADLASVITPKIAVIDGIIAGEGHESSGNPVEMNLVIAGTDPVAVDSVGAAVMMMPPEDVKHLRLAEEKGLGTNNLSQIEILGEPIEKVRKKFRRAILSKFLSHIG
jgi:uncharacterized protein (DUF362 family)